MTDSNHPAANDPAGLSRRALLGAAAAVGGAGLLAGPAGTAMAGGNVLPAGAFGHPEALAAPIDGLSYVSLDAFAFDVASTNSAHYRLYQEVPNTGMEPQGGTPWLNAALTIPIGSVIRQINVAYQGQPLVGVTRRPLAATPITDLIPMTTVPMGNQVSTHTFAVDATLTQGATYAVRAYCTAGSSILGMTIGYVPPAQAFVPYTGNAPRVLDTRPNNRLGAEQEIVVDLTGRVVPTARAAVINLTATETSGPGFLAAFRDGIAHPGNSSVNWVSPGMTVANGVICAMTNNKIRVRTGPASTHVIVDVIGSLL